MRQSAQKTGLEEVRPLGDLARQLQKERLLYLPSREGEGERESWDSLERWRQASLNDPFDGRHGRIGQITSNLRQQFPMLELRDLSPHLDEMRVIKSESEIALMRSGRAARAKRSSHGASHGR